MAHDRTHFRCSVAARERSDTLQGTAAPAAGWVLVEDTGRWAPRAFEDSSIDPAAGRAIVQRAREEDLRPLLIRRHGTRGKADRHAFAVVDSRTGAATWSSYRRLSEVLDHDWLPRDPIAPLFLVCTHGRHDRCCAIHGRPVAAALAALRPEQTWECSHVGGDRFAGNVLVLPYGLYYGFVDPADAGAIVAATERREIHPPLLRGRSSDSPPVQMARTAAQVEINRLGIDDLMLVATTRTDAGWLVSLRSVDSLISVTVIQRRVADARATCAHRIPVPMRELEVITVSVDPD